MNQKFAVKLSALILAGMFSGLAVAEGAANGRERFFLKRHNCPWTEDMGKFIYECVKKNDGFNAHWCHNEALDLYCAADESAIPHPTDSLPGDKPIAPDSVTKS